MRAQFLEFLTEVIRVAGSPEAVAQQLERMGYKGEEGGALSAQTIRAWRRGDRSPTPDAALALAGHYKVSIDRFVVGESLREQVQETLDRHQEALSVLERELADHVAGSKRTRELVYELLGWAWEVEPKLGLSVNHPRSPAVQERIDRELA